MTAIEEVKSMLSAHMENSQKNNEAVIKAIAKIEIHGEYTNKRLDNTEEDINRLQGAHNRQKGMMWAFGVIGFGGIIKLIKDLF